MRRIIRIIYIVLGSLAVGVLGLVALYIVIQGKPVDQKIEIDTLVAKFATKIPEKQQNRIPGSNGTRQSISYTHTGICKALSKFKLNINKQVLDNNIRYALSELQNNNCNYEYVDIFLLNNWNYNTKSVNSRTKFTKTSYLHYYGEYEYYRSYWRHRWGGVPCVAWIVCAEMHVSLYFNKNLEFYKYRIGYVFF